ncbi:Uncharacterised protein [Vibrio cholerae]|nr:Uncharacterised protein [Vibrio cholerae]
MAILWAQKQSADFTASGVVVTKRQQLHYIVDSQFRRRVNYGADVIRIKRHIPANRSFNARGSGHLPSFTIHTHHQIAFITRHCDVRFAEAVF